MLHSDPGAQIGLPAGSKAGLKVQLHVAVDEVQDRVRRRSSRSRSYANSGDSFNTTSAVSGPGTGCCGGLGEFPQH